MGARRAIRCAAVAIIAATPARAVGQWTTLRGRVFDSVAALPLVGAHVELVNADDRSHILFRTTSDSLGRFVVDRVGRGRYIAGFMHPMLDSLGLAITQRLLTVSSDGELPLDLAVPGPERIEDALCGFGEKDTNGAVLGYVLNSHTFAPTDSATVIAEWAEVILGKGGVEHEVLSRKTMTDGNGWFALCGVPTSSSVILRAVSGADTSGGIEIEVPKSRIARRTLYVDRPLPADSGVAVALRADTGHARIDGVVTGWVRSEDGVPIPRARVKLYGSSVVAVTNDSGAFQLAGVPGGTQTLTSRALGFVPDERPVDVTDRNVPVIIGMLTVRRFLDTVHVRAKRPTLTSIVGFDGRRRSGAGKFFTAGDIDRIHPTEVTDILRHAPSVSLATDNSHHVQIRMRGDMESCTPAIFLDGKQLINWELSDLNSLVRPEEIGGMEVYTPSMTPAEFRTKQGCGTILLWTRAPDR
ncbi:MAG TPA: TonB-dependent receptor [Gemmatimonadaceae bacterium]|jgi:hypothetical protein